MRMLTELSTDQFTVDNRARLFIAERSDLGRGFDFERIYPDACDEGITIYGRKSHRSAVFFLAETKKDCEGDVMVWVLKPTTETLKKIPALAGYEVHIIND